MDTTKTQSRCSRSIVSASGHKNDVYFVPKSSMRKWRSCTFLARAVHCTLKPDTPLIPVTAAFVARQIAGGLSSLLSFRRRNGGFPDCTRLPDVWDLRSARVARHKKSTVCAHQMAPPGQPHDQYFVTRLRSESLQTLRRPCVPAVAPAAVYVYKDVTPSLLRYLLWHPGDDETERHRFLTVCCPQE